MPEKNTDRKTQASSQMSPEPHGRDGGDTSNAPPDGQAAYQPKYTPLWENLITIAGIILVGLVVILLLSFGLFSVVSPRKNPYIDIFGFLVLPGLLVVGLLIIPFGILFKSWRLHRRNPEEHLAFRFPRIDLNDPGQRRVGKIVLLCSFTLLPLVGVSSYHGYHYTDSAAFCSKACHAVMEPQSTAYEHSAHARVACAECHIGTGASWFVKSKLSGTRQVLAMWQDSFPRPIPPAISELRPARETCEHCHWPQKFFGAQLREIVHFASDEHNTRRDIDMLLLTGGGDETTGRARGIHKHMALAGQIKYIATDDKLQDIPWVEFVDNTGRRLIYRSDGRPSSDPRPEGRERILDCMDCHNRPAHKFRSPQQAVDIYLDIGKIDTTLPFIKRQATQALVQSYPDSETARAQIGVLIAEFYRTEHPEVWQTRKASVNQAIDQVRQLYEHNFFPDMNVDWRTYPDNIGHLISPGCFRCHDGSHVNQHGDRLSHKCNICHDFLNRVDGGGEADTVQAGEFIHSYKLEGRHAELRCDNCHSGGVAPQPSCEGCHDVQQGLYDASLPQLSGFDVEPDAMFGSVACDDCHDLSQSLSMSAVSKLCLDCHEEQEGYEDMLAAWAESLATGRAGAESALEELDVVLRTRAADQRDGHARRWLAKARDVMEALDKANPLHNPEGSTRILETISREAARLMQPADQQSQGEPTAATMPAGAG